MSSTSDRDEAERDLLAQFPTSGTTVERFLLSPDEQKVAERLVRRGVLWRGKAEYDRRLTVYSRAR